LLHLQRTFRAGLDLFVSQPAFFAASGGGGEGKSVRGQKIIFLPVRKNVP